MPKPLPKKNKQKNKTRVDNKNLFDFDPTLAVRILSKEDPILGKLIKQVGPFKLKLGPIDSPFHALAEAIIHQQLSGSAAKTIFGRVHSLFDVNDSLCPHKILDTPEELLRSAGLSRSKLASIKDLAAKTIDGLVPTAAELKKLGNEEIIQRFTSIRGIGSWTVEMMLIFRLGRQDVLPIHDYGIRKGFALTFDCDDLPKPKELQEYGERWRPYRTVASWYLWRSLELD